jgi:hypothetical protein
MSLIAGANEVSSYGSPLFSTGSRSAPHFWDLVRTRSQLWAACGAPGSETAPYGRGAVVFANVSVYGPEPGDATFTSR